MNREIHVRICEGRRVRLPPATRLVPPFPALAGELASGQDFGHPSWLGSPFPLRQVVRSAALWSPL